LDERGLVGLDACRRSERIRTSARALMRRRSNPWPLRSQRPSWVTLPAHRSLQPRTSTCW